MGEGTAWIRAVWARELFYSSMMIAYGSILHLSWGLLGFIDETAFNSTALSAVATIAGPMATPWICIIVAIIAFSALFSRDALMRVALMMPQQAVFVVSAVGAFLAILHGQYADGVMRPRSFIMADQLPVILSAICYSFSVISTSLSHRMRGNVVGGINGV